MNHFLLFYEFVPDYMERRAPFRSEHLTLAWQAHARGELVLAGAYTEPADGSAALFKAESAETVERFATGDPYVRAGLVKRWYVRKWTTVVGDDASNPVRPAAS
jgi:uncharacterized protein YciI